MTKDIIADGQIESRILLIRGHRVILDSTLAGIYGTTTKRLNEQIRRNAERFPADFMFRLTSEEAHNLRSHFATSSGHGGRRHTPYAFTEYGAIQAANVVSSKAAIQAGIAVVRAFARLRSLVSAHKDLTAKLARLEARVGVHDEDIKSVIEAIRQLGEGFTQPDAHAGPKKRIGFDPD
ncbi:MAG: ORF6N domain-containing protein [Elusimicrobiales bacterium]|nr:ORF6N domain-containing protein [Elusimicrobiales bacterium]